MAVKNPLNKDSATDSLHEMLYEKHLRGAYVRAGSSAAMWLLAFFSYLTDMLNLVQFVGISTAVIYLIVINPPALWIFKRIKKKPAYKFFSFLINQFEIMGYTTVIYFVGGIRAGFLTLLYAAMIVYVGVAAPKTVQFKITALCALNYSAMVALEHFSVIPHQFVGAEFEYPAANKVGVVLVVTVLLMVVAFISGFVAKKLRKVRIDLQKKNAELKDKTKELLQTQAQLIQSGKLASVGELVAGMCHELNQPLMVVRSSAQVALMRKARHTMNAAKVTGLFEIIERNTKRMMKIIDHMRTFSGQSRMSFEALDINTVIKNALLMIGEQLRVHDIELVEDFDPNLPMVRGDANQLEQVFLNLITNARDAVAVKAEMDDPKSDSVAGRSRRIRAQNRFTQRITIITRVASAIPIQSPSGQDAAATVSDPPESSGYIEVLFQDNGIGIQADITDKIFDPFFTTKEVGKGTGLGLSISYGIIKDHEGKIEMGATGPAGTTIRIYLPVAEAVPENRRQKLAKTTPLSPHIEQN